MKALYSVPLLCILLITSTGGYAMGSSRQGNVMSQQCPTGGKEAEEIYQLGRKYRGGHGGFPKDNEKAEKLFEQALAMGNAKAALQIGQMYRLNYGYKPDEGKRHKYMVAMFEQAMKMGCPEGYQSLGECYEKGWGVRADKKKAMELLQKAAEMGSPKAMEFYGNYLIKSQRQLELGRQWLKRSMALGNGDAGDPLADSYIFAERSIDGIVKSLRAGAALGSKQCLLRLEMLYENGSYGQKEDLKHASCYAKLRAAIDDFDAPRPIPNFDKICPLKQPYQPFKEW